MSEAFRLMLDAVAFAGRAHHGQMRKDRQTPYVSHVFRVCMIVRDRFGIDDPRVLIAALLHDTIEDTLIDFDDLEAKFGREIAEWVALLSKNKKLRYAERESAYCAELTTAPWQVQVCKLADVFDNLIDMDYLQKDKQRDAMKKKRMYLDALKLDLKPEAAKAWSMVDALYRGLDGLNV